MFGIDIGLNIASVVLIGTKKVAYHKILNNKDSRDIPEFERIKAVADVICRAVINSGFSAPVSIEEPIYSWGRKNPKGFAKSVMLFTLLRFQLESNGYLVHPVNNKSAKKMAGHGGKDKEGMVKAFKRETKQKIDKYPKYAQETIADSYFIARTGRMMYGTRTKG